MLPVIFDDSMGTRNYTISFLLFLVPLPSADFPADIERGLQKNMLYTFLLVWTFRLTIMFSEVIEHRKSLVSIVTNLRLLCHLEFHFFFISVKYNIPCAMRNNVEFVLLEIITEASKDMTAIYYALSQVSL